MKASFKTAFFIPILITVSLYTIPCVYSGHLSIQNFSESPTTLSNIYFAKITGRHFNTKLQSRLRLPLALIIMSEKSGNDLQLDVREWGQISCIKQILMSSSKQISQNWLFSKWFSIATFRGYLATLQDHNISELKNGDFWPLFTEYRLLPRIWDTKWAHKYGYLF